MSAFIVISLKEELNWIVDGIKECRPHNPNVVTYLSIGKLRKQEEGRVLYEYSAYSKHDVELWEKDFSVQTTENDVPENVFSNQIAHFLNMCESGCEQTNIFLLDNPVTDEDYERSLFLIKAIEKVHEKHIVTNFQLVRVLFSYQVDKPTDVNKQISQLTLNQLMRMSLDKSNTLLTRILYIDNQNRSGAATCLDRQSHDIMIPRMLCDFMMILSSNNVSYNVSAAITGETNMFSIGYAECMYYHDDVSRYYYLAGERDLIQYLLESPNIEKSLNYNVYPIGLNERVKQLESKYNDVPFNEDISLFESSIDKSIDDILKIFKEDIISIREEKLRLAKLEDCESTKLNRIAYLKSSGKLQSDISNDAWNSNYESIAAELGIDLSHITVSDSYNRVCNEFPEYIDRGIIYENYLLENTDDEETVADFIIKNKDSYDKLVAFVQKKEFKKYVFDRCNSFFYKFEEKNVETNNVIIKKESKKGFLRRVIEVLRNLFRSRNASANIVETKTIEPHVLNRDWQSLSKYILSISQMCSEREDYNSLKKYIYKLREKRDNLDKEIKNYKLTTHCSSVDSLIDLDKLKIYHSNGKNDRISRTLKKWMKREDNEKSYNTLLEDFKEITKWDLFDFYYVKWDNKFDFIKDVNIDDVCKRLMNKSIPFVNTYTLDAYAENLTSYYFYSDNKEWIKSLNNGNVHLCNSNKISSVESKHICSKICMFQFLQMNKELIEGLVDLNCFEKSEKYL